MRSFLPGIRPKNGTFSVFRNFLELNAKKVVELSINRFQMILRTRWLQPLCPKNSWGLVRSDKLRENSTVVVALLIGNYLVRNKLKVGQV